IVVHKLHINTAIHSPFVNPCETWRQSSQNILVPTSPKPRRCPLLQPNSNFKSDLYTPNYMWNNLCQPVLFSSAIPKIIERFRESTVFIEVSPHPVLSQVSDCSGLAH
ncbi:hypothetical protein BU15DRAFT_56601, partial [Melanogaster broomeanus]